jgi:hypothetical protein
MEEDCSRSRKTQLAKLLVYEPDDPELYPQQGQEVSLLQNVQKSSGTSPASIQWVLSSGVKRLELEDDNTPSLISVKN